MTVHTNEPKIRSLNRSDRPATATRTDDNGVRVLKPSARSADGAARRFETQSDASELSPMDSARLLHDPSPQAQPEPEQAQPAQDPMQRAVLHRLDQLDLAAERNKADDLLPLARVELGRLAQSWRTLLDQHCPDEDGRCLACAGTFRGRRWPCSVWATAHQRLISVDPAGASLGTRSADSHGPGSERPRHRAPDPVPTSQVPVLTTPIVSDGSSDPGQWDTVEFELPELPQPPEVTHPPQPPASAPSQGPMGSQDIPDVQDVETTQIVHSAALAPPIGGHLETDHRRIHRASVVARPARARTLRPTRASPERRP